MKTILEPLLKTHPHADQARARDYSEAVATLNDCVAACTLCADACLAETEHVAMLRRCITTDLDCADVCAVAVRLLLRQTEPPNDLVHAQLHACVIACQRCADECAEHASRHAHCKLCAEVCRYAQERCNFLLGEITSSGTAESISEDESPSLSM
jgi:hypothetical protein